MFLASNKKGNLLAQVAEKVPESVVSGRACSRFSEVPEALLCLSALPSALETSPTALRCTSSSQGYVPHTQAQKGEELTFIQCSQERVTLSGPTWHCDQA